MFCCCYQEDNILNKNKEKLETSMNLFHTRHQENDIVMKIRGTKECENDEHWILTLSLTDLSAKLQNGDVKAVDVLLAYKAKAIEVHKKTNSVVCWVEGAYKQAQELDILSETERGPLHGIPFSVKDAYNIAGTYSTGGLAKFIGEDYVAQDDSMLLPS